MALFCNSKSSHVLEDEEFNAVSMDLNNWTIPKIPIKKIYKTEIFKLFSSDHKIKTEEHKLSVTGKGGQAKLLDSSQITHLKYEYDYLHVGMVQIGVKTATRKDTNGSVFLCLRDGRNSSFKDSILGMVDARLDGGPIYFNCFPNSTLSLSSYHFLEALILNIKLYGFDKGVPLGSQPIILTYRVCFKAMKNEFDPKSLAESPVGKTQLFQRNPRTSSVSSQSMIWEEMQETCSWTDLKEEATKGGRESSVGPYAGRVRIQFGSRS